MDEIEKVHSNIYTIIPTEFSIPVGIKNSPKNAEILPATSIKKNWAKTLSVLEEKFICIKFSFYTENRTSLRLS
jgi:hypothetical protein